MNTVEEWLHRPIESHVTVDMENTESMDGIILTGMGAGRDGSGTTRSLFHLIHRLAKHDPERSYCIVDFHLTEPCLDTYFASNAKVMNLDSLYKQITDRITPSMLRENIVINKNMKNLYLLPGTRRPFSADSFSAEVLMAVLAALKQIFHVVVVDVSAHFDNPATVAGLLSADRILVFSNYDEDGIRLFNLYRSTIFHHHPQLEEKLHMIGVEMFKGRKVDLSDLTLVPVITHLPHIPGFQYVFEEEKADLKGKSANKYLQALDRILKSLDLIQENIKSTEQKGRRRLRWLIRRSSNSNV